MLWHAAIVEITTAADVHMKRMKGWGGGELLNKVVIFVFFAHKDYSHSFIRLRLNRWCHMDYFTVSGAENISVVLLCMEGQRALGFHHKYHQLCSEDEWSSYGFGTTWGWVINRGVTRHDNGFTRTRRD